MSRHHWMYFGCQCSSARCSRLLLERLTLLGIFSAEIMMPRCQCSICSCRGQMTDRREGQWHPRTPGVSPCRASFWSPFFGARALEVSLVSFVPFVSLAFFTSFSSRTQACP